MGPIRISNPGIFGGAPAFGPAQAPAPRSIFLGQESTEKTEAAAALQGARLSFDRVVASHGKLTHSMGQESADQAYEEAADSLRKAQENYDSLGG